MRICFLSRRFFPAISGMSVYAANLLRELAANGHDLTMISQYRADPAGASIYGGGPPPEVPGVRVIGLESTGEQAVNRGGLADFEADLLAMVETVCREHDRQGPFDLIHAQYGYPNGLAALEAGRRLALPVVVSIQGGDGHWVGSCCRTHRDAMRAVLEHSGALLIGSASFAAEVAANNGVDPGRFTIVPGATDTTQFRPRADRDPGTLGDPPTLLYHGRVDARKGVIELVDAVGILRDAGRSFRAIISGIGPAVDAVAARVRALDLGGVVELSGYAPYEQAAEVYRRGDIFVSPTYSEGFSNTILEAMATGLPIVSTWAVGVVDCLVDGANGLLVEPGDAVVLASAVARLLDDDPLRIRLARRGLDDVRRLYGWPAVAGRIEQAYRSVIGRPTGSAWLSTYDPGVVSVANAAPSCRFRSEPHLL